MDLGERAIQTIYEILKLDEMCSVRFERGFTWWGYQLAQTVWAEPLEEIDGVSYARLLGRIDFVQGFTGSEAQIEYLQNAGARSCFSGFVRHPEDASRICLQQSATLDEESYPWLPLFFSATLALQNTEANVFSGKLPASTGMTANPSDHPVSGRQEEPHPIIRAFGGAVVDLREQPSRYAGKEMLDTLALFRQAPVTFAEGDADWLAVRFALNGQLSAAEFLTTEPDLWYGNGLQVLSRFEGSGKTFDDVLDMNDRESKRVQGLPGMGKWYLFEDSALGFGSFYPNFLYARNAMENLMHATVLRAQWFAKEVCGNGWSPRVPQKTLRDAVNEHGNHPFYPDHPSTELKPSLAMLQWEGGQFEVPYDILKGVVFLDCARILFGGDLREVERLRELSSVYPKVPSEAQLGYRMDGIMEAFVLLDDPMTFEDFDMRHMERMLNLGSESDLQSSSTICQLFYQRVGQAIDGNLEDACHAACAFFERAKVKEPSQIVVEQFEYVHTVESPHLTWIRMSHLFPPAETMRGDSLLKLLAYFIDTQEEPNFYHLTVDLCHALRGQFGNDFWSRDFPGLAEVVLHTARPLVLDMSTLAQQALLNEVQKRGTPDSVPSGQTVSEAIDRIRRTVEIRWGYDLTKSHPLMYRGEKVDRVPCVLMVVLENLILQPNWFVSDVATKGSPPKPITSPPNERIRASDAKPKPDLEPKKGFFARWKKS